VRGANPEFVPTGAEVASRITDGDVGGVIGEVVDDEQVADEMDATVEEVRKARQLNEERQQAEARQQAETAKNYSDEIAARVDNAVHRLPGPIEHVDQRDAIAIAERIADEAAKYAENLLAAAMRQRRQRRRAQLNAERRLLLDIERQADAILDHLERERDAARSDQEPVEA